MNLPSNIKKICVFRALQLGDMLCTIPAIRALRNQYPAAQITLLGLPWAASLVQRFPEYFSDFVKFPGYPGLPEQNYHPSEIVEFMRWFQSEKYDLLLQMQGNGTIVNSMLPLLGAKYLAGFYLKHDFQPNPEYFFEYPEGIHEISRHLGLMNFLGISSKGTELEYPLTEKDEAELRALELTVSPKKYVIVHPGSRGAWRQWPVEHFAALGDYASSLGLDVLITGTKDETEITQSVQEHMENKAINLAGKTSMGAVGVLIRDAFALISNCTGVSHIAAALETPSIVISMDGEPERWGPLNHELHKTIDWTKQQSFNYVLQQATDLFQSQRKGSFQA